MKKILLRFLVLVGLLAFAVPCYATFSLENGSISWSSGIYATPPWNDSSTQLSWNIQDQGDGWVLYEYTWNTTSKDLSHIILEISANADMEDFKDFNITPVLGTYDASDGNSNPGMPGALYGLKFGGDSTNVTISFLSTRLPMWGSFYAKDGSYKIDGVQYPVYAYNTGFGETPTDNGKFIAVPDTKTPEVPLPGAVWLLGAGLLGLVGVRRKFSK